MKKLNQVASVLSVAALLASLAMPVAASAAGTVSAAGVQAVNISTTNSDFKDLGSVKVEVPVSDLNMGDFFFLRLPTDFKINVSSSIDPTIDIAGATITRPDGTTEPLIQTAGGADPWNDGAQNHVSVFQTSANELKVVVKDAARATTDALDADTVLKLNLGSVYVPGSADDNISATIEGKIGSAFTNGSVTVANKGTSTVNVSVDSVKTISENGKGTLDTIRFKEDSPGAFSSGNGSLSLKLPYGFAWSNSSYTVNFIDGDRDTVGKITATRSADPSELVITVPNQTKYASYFTITNAGIEVQDSSTAQFGDIDLSVSGSSKTNTNSLVVGKYASFVTSVSAGVPKQVIAGRAGANDSDHTEIGQLSFQENAPGSLRADGVIRLQLTGGAKWAVDQSGKLVQAPQIDTALSDLQGLQLDESTGNHGWELASENGDTIMAKVKTASSGTQGAKMVLDKALVDTDADAQPSEVHVVVSGTAGVSGDAGAVANIVTPVTISIPDTTPKHVQVGMQNRTISDMIVKENVAGAINAGNIQFTFQPGVAPSPVVPSQVQVDGDLVLNTSGMVTAQDAKGNWYIQIPVMSASTTPSTIHLNGEQVTVDRSVPEGDLSVNVGGSMIQTKGSDSVAQVTAAKIIYTADGTSMNSATFVIGSNSYTVNEQQKTLDVAPFLDENGRTQLPVRAVAEALGGVVGWDPQDGTVTLLKDGKAISITVGSYVMNVGGVFVQNDSPAINKDGRVFLPFRIIAEALGAKVDWDPSTKTVYLN